LGIDAGVRHDAGCAVFGVPHATTGVEAGRVDGDGAAAVSPGLELLDQAAQAADLGRQGLG
jgi:hypothetical protein